MRLDLPYFIAELLVLWVPLSFLLWLTQQLGINWIYTDIIMLVAYVLIVFLCQVNAFLSAIFHVKKREGNVWLETLLFWVVTIGSLFLALHIIDNIVLGIMVVMFLSILSSSIIIGP